MGAKGLRHMEEAPHHTFDITIRSSPASELNVTRTELHVEKGTQYSSRSITGISFIGH